MPSDTTTSQPEKRFTQEAVQSMAKLFELLIQIDQRERKSDGAEHQRDKHNTD